MKIFLAGRYGRRIEIQKHADDLIAIGHQVVSTWHNFAREDLDAKFRFRILDDETRARAASIARDNLTEMMEASDFIFFTEAPDEAWPGGGRHVELGFAIAIGRTPLTTRMPVPRIILCGPYAENQFMHFDWMERYATWPDVLVNIGAAPLVARQ